ncbi:aminotransferase class I/II-fold pyridoxal phosphate-dependent enzyme [Demequina sp. SYSU T00192]|uniref:Aminotransferase class I/II-fold pyridoxal phosphate-dependent enzyme n=1 Tax=Demequina litoralis TaxID=3051660 RepID=A0ABT8G9E5_9MICO|nr:aminotransferase class I/II-fold pyridoxal phosphate-dependent enzyme [Demequina sp. SYSU T00192]MDN4475309.1 aminotransferase class I/II-fold pyridoxal phosphate-dependent enzyme [Demequina sp. SYSU T00192]
MLIDTLAAHIEEPNPQGIASALSMLIRTGEIAPRTRLPTVRAVATRLGVSPGTVSQAWHGLVQAGLIEVRGRAGSYVLEPRTPWLTPRSGHLADRGDDAPMPRLDLALGMPDPMLLPDITAALERVAPRRAAVSSYLQPPLLPELEAPLRELWPSKVGALTVVDGVMDGIERTLRSVARFGDRVVVETPTFPVLLDLLDHLHLMAVPARIDAEGMVPESLEAALASRPAAVVIQPRAHNPTGVSMTPARAARLADVLERHRYGRDAVVIEDDHTGQVAAAMSVSLGAWIPHRTIHVAGFSKSHGPDLRIAALGGPAAAVERIVGYRVLGPGWTSRLLQAVLHDLLTSRASVHAIDRARHAYFIRQRELAACLRGAGIDAATADGLNAWVPVRDEHAARVTLAAHGIRVSRGSAFLVRSELNGDAEGPHTGDHIRVSLGALRESIPAVAGAIAAAATTET